MITIELVMELLALLVSGSFTVLAPEPLKRLCYGVFLLITLVVTFNELSDIFDEEPKYWEDIRAHPTIVGLQEYIKKYPNGDHRSNADNTLMEIAESLVDDGEKLVAQKDSISIAKACELFEKAADVGEERAKVYFSNCTKIEENMNDKK